MYVCICRGITQQQIEDAIQQGGSVSDICSRLGVGSDCGVCLQEAVEFTLAKSQQGATSAKSPSLTKSVGRVEQK